MVAAVIIVVMVMVMVIKDYRSHRRVPETESMNQSTLIVHGCMT